ncbi:mitochondrial putative cytochrome c peroxidase [Fimicolochytrium jonesii]|uniref:mitochondrial putative cytochrome c peroxidase n=1 Tax=Fimicolochytrium jonesii TaxID=1396493 RepID=UPI0022FEB9F8|nr:mitochondrial putative cytochrome c peroxidase [Fimicolochytrium jonesii]KAI8822211.1 mitochondrial putative cytochrome c peroxidase [Fimicolochytrium jonesii]
MSACRRVVLLRAVVPKPSIAGALRAQPLSRTYSAGPAAGQPSSPPPPPPSNSGGSSKGLLYGLALAAAGAGGYYYYQSTGGDITAGANPERKNIKKNILSPADYQKVYEDVANILDSNPDYDDGSYGPVLIRLAWHASGTYDKNTGSGGSNGATMRFPVEGEWSANAGLKVARDILEPIKKKWGDALSYSDLWIIAGIAAVQELGGPTVKFRPGRVDSLIDTKISTGLPDATKEDPKHSRDIFYRMGFNDQEIIALLGAHSLGRCHADRSGFDGPWTFSPTTFSNDYFKRLLGETWVVKKWKGPKQYADKATSQLMMLPAEIVYPKDKEFRKWVETYAKDEEKFAQDFAKAFEKLTELGVPFPADTPTIQFKRLE